MGELSKEAMELREKVARLERDLIAAKADKDKLSSLEQEVAMLKDDKTKHKTEMTSISVFLLTFINLILSTHRVFYFFCFCFFSLYLPPLFLCL